MLGLFNKKENKENSGEKQMPANQKSKLIGGRKLQGIVVSNKMKKTVVVAVSNYKLHSKYKKFITSTKRFKAHDEKNEYQIGDKVVIQETRPLSKEKRWLVVSKL